MIIIIIIIHPCIHREGNINSRVFACEQMEETKARQSRGEGRRQRANSICSRRIRSRGKDRDSGRVLGINNGCHGVDFGMECVDKHSEVLGIITLITSPYLN